ncbi:cell envelope integrity protein CreD [Teichococcus deserti]|uniref:cell envelope integrity protein CreD n=1 Tax=Teichococcus deserti TaxID=1817963 RepID=UPI0013F5B49A|nr:cell envelope integrity protein CreD [Pseudoroseomonas deserti]
MIPPLPTPPEETAPPVPTPPRPTLGPLPRKLVGLLTLGLLLLVPHLLVDDVISERQNRQQEVEEEIGRSWGRPQSVLGPVLVLPYVGTLPSSGSQTEKRGRGEIMLLPTQLNARAVLAPETRKRGVFETTVYTAQLSLEGSLTLPPIAVPGVADAELLWREAYLLTGATELRSGGGRLTVDGTALAASDIPGDPSLCGPAETQRWPLRLEAAPEAGRELRFAQALELRGTSRLHLLPLAGQTRLHMEAPWPSPSFGGAALPQSSDVTAAGFTADWSMRGRGLLLRQNLRACGEPDGIGVTLLESVPTHRMVSRASKYAMLFLSLAFVTYLCFELVARARIHLVQYGLMGCSVLLFPLLLLAIGEPLGFGAAYLIASLAVLLQATGHTAAVTRRPGMAAVFAGVVGLLFGFLYVVLSLESYALLVGALALFAALSAVMAVTRKVDWQ